MEMPDIFIERFGDVVGRGAQAAVYARGDVAVKVYNAGYPKEYVFYEAAVMSFVEPAGVPMPKAYEVLRLDGRMCLRMSRVTGRPVSEIAIEEPSRGPALLDDLVRLQMEIHRKGIPLPLRLKPKLRDLIACNEHLDEGRKAALFALAGELPEGDALCHGDFHSGNVILEGATYWVIDWIDATRGDPLVDACHSYVAYAVTSREAAEAYLERYCTASGAGRKEVLRWLPVQAGILYGRIPDRFDPVLIAMMDGDGWEPA